MRNTTSPGTSWRDTGPMGDTYTHGHHESVLRSHSSRTAENSAAYLLDRLEPGMSLLDVGCGPGTISVDLADLVAPGEVVAIDSAAEVVHQAEAERERRGTANVEFRTGDVYDLDFDDDRFDVVHAHQVLQHLTDPVGALREMGRVLRPGGLIAVRDGDYGAFTWAPDNPRLERWNEVYHAVTARNGGQADAGRYLLGWVQRAGLDVIAVSSSTWTFADPASRAWWGGTWAERITRSAVADQAVEYGISTAEELADIADGFQSWADADDGVFIVVHGEVLASA